jgi:hypothetical protein
LGCSELTLHASFLDLLGNELHPPVSEASYGEMPNLRVFTTSLGYVVAWRGARNAPSRRPDITPFALLILSLAAGAHRRGRRCA